MFRKIKKFYLEVFRDKLLKTHQVLLEFDKFPLLPSNLAISLLDIIRIAKHIKLVFTNKEYARLNNLKRRRKGEYAPFSNLLDLYHELAPENKFQKLLRLISKVEPSLMTRALLDTFDMLFKGYKQTQVWDLDYDISDRVGRQLIELSTITHGWPDRKEFSSFEEWVTTLREHGENLVKYSRRDAYLMPLYLKAKKLEKSGHKLESGEFKKEHDRLEKEIYKNAKNAFTFIAKYHSDLWD